MISEDESQCHPERSEGSRSASETHCAEAEVLRFAQDDSLNAAAEVLRFAQDDSLNAATGVLRFAQDDSLNAAAEVEVLRFAQDDRGDAANGTWTLRSHAAVSDALASAALTTDLASTNAQWNENSDESIRIATRAAARDLFPAQRLSEWRASLEMSARTRVDSLPFDTPVDLMRAVAEPWSLSLAVDTIGASSEEASHLNAFARAIFLDAAMASGAPESSLRSADRNEPTLALAKALARRQPGHTIDVQSFVAISQTLPHLLVAIWYALLTHVDQIDVWQSATDKSVAIDELLRYAGPSRAVFRRARRATQCSTTVIEAGEYVTLMLADANRDPLVFAAPDQLDLTRQNASRHVALGGGLHKCVGTPIIRLAVEAATTALLERVNVAVVIEDVQWLDGFAIRAPSSLVIRLADRRP